MKRLALILPLLALAAAPARAEDPATNAAPVYLASMLDLGCSSTARNQEVVTAEGVWLANLSDRHPGGCIRTIRALLATNGVEVRIDVLPGTKMKTVPTSNGIVRLEPVELREWVNHEKVLVPFADVPCVVQLEKWADVFGNEAWSRVLLERRYPSSAAAAADADTAALVEEARHLCTYAPVDFPRAVELLRRAEAAGDADATAFLGKRHEYGEGVPYDPVRARELYRAAADRGSFFGRCFAAESVLAVPDAEAAVAELSALAESGHRFAWLACSALVHHYERRGWRTFSDASGPERALAVAWRARLSAMLAPLARAGDPEARVAYGNLLLFPGPSADFDSFGAGAAGCREWFLPEAERGSIYAMWGLVVSCDTNVFSRPLLLPDDPAADAEAAALRGRWSRELVAALERAVEQECVTCAFWLGEILADYTWDASDPVRGAELLRRAADAGHPGAALRFGVHLERGAGVGNDEAAAEARYRAVLAADRLAAADARAEAAQRLARLLLRRGPDGRPEAKRLLNLARKEPVRYDEIALAALRAWKKDGPAAALRILDRFYPDIP
ncbi:MAG: sel1 repeat family protein [Kiritimatiellae bacterium]|nr:sel1 repeat family protein [Kiritimatiellia bacterium]